MGHYDGQHIVEHVEGQGLGFLRDFQWHRGNRLRRDHGRERIDERVADAVRPHPTDLLLVDVISVDESFD